MLNHVLWNAEIFQTHSVFFDFRTTRHREVVNREVVDREVVDREVVDREVEE